MTISNLRSEMLQTPKHLSADLMSQWKIAHITSCDGYSQSTSILKYCLKLLLGYVYCTWNEYCVSTLVLSLRQLIICVQIFQNEPMWNLKYFWTRALTIRDAAMVWMWFQCLPWVHCDWRLGLQNARHYWEMLWYL